MKKGIYILPNALTLAGILAGFYAVLAAIKGNFIDASWAVLAAMIFDGLDGFVARLTGSASRFGIELDSLSDLVSFGVAPGVLIYLASLSAFERVGALVAFLYVACGAMRLARYNVQMVTAERKYFTGVPIPAGAVIISTLVIFSGKTGVNIYHSVPVLLLTFVVSLLMVSTLRFHGMKEINFSRRKPFWLLVTVVIAFVVVAMHPEVSLFFVAMAYLFAGLVENAIILYLRKRRYKA